MIKKTGFIFVLLVGLFAFAQVCDDGQPVNLVPPGTVGDAPGSLSTIFASNNGFAGNMFDVEVMTPLTITGFDVNVSNAGPGTIQLYYREGTCVGNETNPGAWTLFGEDTSVVGNGPNNPTPVNISGLQLVPGQVYGFYIHDSTYSALRMEYTNGSPTVYSNAEMTITSHCGVSSPAFNSFFADRIWNGTIYYDTALTIPTLSQWGLIAFVVLLLAAGVVFMRRHAAANRA